MSENRVTVRYMYENMTEQVMDRISLLRTEYEKNDSMQKRAVLMQLINIEMVQCRPCDTILKEYPESEIDISHCSAATIHSLMELWTIINSKSSAQAKVVNEKDMEQFGIQAVNDLINYYEIGVFNKDKWLKNNVRDGKNIGCKLSRALNNRAVIKNKELSDSVEEIKMKLTLRGNDEDLKILDSIKPGRTQKKVNFYSVDHQEQKYQLFDFIKTKEYSIYGVLKVCL